MLYLLINKLLVPEIKFKIEAWFSYVYKMEQLSVIGTHFAVTKQLTALT